MFTTTEIATTYELSPAVLETARVVDAGERNGGIQIVLRFPNGYGASIIRGPYTYGGESGLFELAVLTFARVAGGALTYDTPITDDVEGYLTPSDVDALLLRIAELPAA